MNSYEIINKIKREEIDAIQLGKLYKDGRISKEFYEETMKLYFSSQPLEDLENIELKERLEQLEAVENKKRNAIKRNKLIVNKEKELSTKINKVKEEIKILDYKIQKNQSLNIETEENFQNHLSSSSDGKEFSSVAIIISCWIIIFLLFIFS